MAPLPPPPAALEDVGTRAPLGIYFSAPFCRSKCSYCNFASQVYPARVYLEYCELLAREIGLAAAEEGMAGAAVDSIYWGGGTPTLLPPAGIARIAQALREHFRLAPDVEHTCEAAPGTLTPEAIDALAAAGVNRVSLGVQSFVDQEARSVGRLHGRATVFADIERLRQAGIANLNLDLIAGLPHQTAASWEESLTAALDTGVPHLSIYMLEVDEDSRLGGELLAGGMRYHAHHVPDDDVIADAYERACARLEAAGQRQYEISNFAEPGFESRHNLRYWRRRPYLGFGLDAHSLLDEHRFANPDRLEAYLEPLRAGRLPRGEREPISALARLEETLFLGLRMREGIDLAAFELEAGTAPGFFEWLAPRRRHWLDSGLTSEANGRCGLSSRGRLLSNRVFGDCLGFAASGKK